jgi:hypothetical protein
MIHGTYSFSYGAGANRPIAEMQGTFDRREQWSGKAHDYFFSADFSIASEALGIHELGKTPENEDD